MFSLKVARDRGRHHGLGVPARDETTEPSSHAELPLPRDVADDLRQRFLPIRMRTTDPRDPLIRPRGFGE
jgi:hypothetical protein